MHRIATRPAPLDFPLPSAYSTFGDKRRALEPSKHTPAHFQARPVKIGLHTPPADEMTTYQHPQYNPYASRPDSAYSHSATVTSGSSYGGFSAVRQYSVPHPHSSLNQLAAPSASLLRNDSQTSQQSYRRPTSPLSSTRSNTLGPEEPTPRPSNKNNSIVASLQIPLSINDSGGSLAEFAAQITCLFWFESTETLKKAENVGSNPPPGSISRLREEAMPSSGFRKWVVTILSTTQVTQNVILLALLFIYRLKKINPAVKGRSGSEYRLLTVALMLGNKFLDDNTYTNKTWAEVSGISVTEIHVMEVEFLSNMRYSLLASKEQWQEWQEKLGKFWSYCDEAAKAPIPQISPQAHAVLPPALPSPPGPMQNSPPSLNGGYPSTNNTGSHYNQQWQASYGAQVSSPVPTMPAHDLRSSARKRSYDGNSEQSASKRVTRPAPNGSISSFPSTAPARRNDIPRLPVPNLTISTSQPMSSYNHPSSALSQNVPLLPPLNGARSMSAVYPATPSWAPNLPHPVLTPTGPPSQHGTPNGNGYSTPSRRTSPHSVQDLLSLGSSPISGNFPAHNPGHISPSFFLQQRNSPYKPVRHVNTLLYPPPSASMHGYSVNVDQMHYQPLGRRNDYRPGVVPEYASQGSYHQQQWPVLPQPNFHA